MAGTIHVQVNEGIIVATYTGEMTLDLVKEAQAAIEKYLEETSCSKILYNTAAMENPSIKLALDMKSFDAKIRDKVDKSATVVPGALTAFKASIAFILSKNHRVFHNDVEGALNWLKA